MLLLTEARPDEKQLRVKQTLPKEVSFPLVGVITDHLIDGSWYGDNIDQRGFQISLDPIATV